MPKVTFVNENKTIEVPEGANLREEARKAGINLYPGLARWLNCLGHGQCGTCKVLVKKGDEDKLSPKGALERVRLLLMISSIGKEKEMRLACQCQVKGDCTIITQPGLQVSPEKDAKGKYFWETPYPNK